MHIGDGFEENRKKSALISLKNELNSTLKVLAVLRHFQDENFAIELSELEEYRIAFSQCEISEVEYMERASVPYTDVYTMIFRVLFPEIEFFGNCLTGNTNQSIGAVGFIKKYFAQVNPEYEIKGALVWALCRHSSIHQGSQIKKISYKGKSISTSCSVGAPERHLVYENNLFSIDVTTLIEDFEKAVKLYMDDVSKNDQMALTYFIYVISLIERPDNFDLEKYQQNNHHWFKPEDLKFLD